MKTYTAKQVKQAIEDAFPLGGSSDNHYKQYYYDRDYKFIDATTHEEFFLNVDSLSEAILETLGKTDEGIE